MIEIVNRQRQKPMDAKRWQSFTEKALKASGKAGHGVTIAFISNRQIQSLNKRFRGINRATDVLSFPSDNGPFEEEMGPSLGEIAISVERAATQANENGLQFDDEIAQLILHGLLHLSGYDHETDNGEMNRLELRLRRRLGITG
jgi:probable rRNA maturation factor